MTLRNNMLQGMLQGMLQLETAASNWWSTLSDNEKKTYIGAHPASKYARQAGVKKGARAVGEGRWESIRQRKSNAAGSLADKHAALSNHHADRASRYMDMSEDETDAKKSRALQQRATQHDKIAQLHAAAHKHYSNAYDRLDRDVQSDADWNKAHSDIQKGRGVAAQAEKLKAQITSRSSAPNGKPAASARKPAAAPAHRPAARKPAAAPARRTPPKGNKKPMARRKRPAA